METKDTDNKDQVIPRITLKYSEDELKISGDIHPEHDTEVIQGFLAANDYRTRLKHDLSRQIKTSSNYEVIIGLLVFIIITGLTTHLVSSQKNNCKVGVNNHVVSVI